MLIFNTNLCYLCSQLLVSHRSISFFLFPIIRIHFPLCNRFWPVYSFFPFYFEKFNKLQLKFTNWIYLFFSYCTFETYIIQWGIKIADCYCSLVMFCEVFFVNIVHRKPGKPGAKSCECMISVCTTDGFLYQGDPCHGYQDHCHLGGPSASGLCL